MGSKWSLSLKGQSKKKKKMFTTMQFHVTDWLSSALNRRSSAHTNKTQHRFIPTVIINFFFLSNPLHFFLTDRLHLISAPKKKKKKDDGDPSVTRSRSQTVTRRRSVFVQPVFFTDGGIYFQIRTSPPTLSRRHLRENSAPAVQTTAGYASGGLFA